MGKKLSKYVEVCKCHWKEIFAISFVMHFVFDWFIFALGVLLGMHLGH